MDVLIRGGQVVRASGVERCDIAIDGGRVAEIAPELSGRAAMEIDARELHVFAGLIDAHVHFNEPGRADWEGVATGSSALAAGGGTLFFDMPLNSSPAVLDGVQFDRKLAACRAASVTDFALWGGLTPVNLDKLEELAARGVIGFKAFMSNSGIDEFPAVDDWSLYQGMKIAKKLGVPVAVHAESEVITSELSRRAAKEGRTDWRAFVESRPIVAEVEAIARAITFSEETGCSLHVVHVANSRGTELVRRAAARKEAEITCETCPHYLVLNENDLERLGPRAKCAPPLRKPADNDALWQDIVDGKISFVASDHSPCPPSMKDTPTFAQAWGGIAGVQSTLSILLSRGPALPMPLIAQVTSENVAERFRIARKGKIEVGYDADLTLVDADASYELTREQLLDRHKQSPYVGRVFKGVVRRTLVRGQTVFQDGKIVSKPIGRLVTRATE